MTKQTAIREAIHEVAHMSRDEKDQLRSLLSASESVESAEMLRVWDEGNSRRIAESLLRLDGDAQLRAAVVHILEIL